MSPPIAPSAPPSGQIHTSTFTRQVAASLSLERVSWTNSHSILLFLNEQGPLTVGPTDILFMLHVLWNDPWPVLGGSLEVTSRRMMLEGLNGTYQWR